MAINLTFRRIPPSLAVPIAIFIAACASTSPRETVAPIPTEIVQPYPVLASRIDHFLRDTLFPPSNAGIVIYSLTRGEILYTLNPDLLLAPASNQKILTAAAALELLEPDFRFATEVFVDTTVRPRIVIRGAGDPLMDEDDLDIIASAIALRVDTSLTWELVADQSFFDNTRKGKGWMWDDDPYVAPIGPLSVNGNSIDILVRPGLYPGAPTTAELIDTVSGRFALVNLSTTGFSGREDSLVFQKTQERGTELITIDGTLGPERRESRTEIGVSDPTTHFLEQLGLRLTSHRLKIGTVTTGFNNSGDVPAFTLFRDLDSVLSFMLKESDNLCAENLFRTLGQTVTGKPGSSEGGILAVKTSLDRFGIDTARVSVADGSGVSRYNLVSVRTLVRLLEELFEQKEMYRRFRSALPIAGVDGSLSTRMKQTPAQGNLRAKTGTLRGASSLSGYVTTADGELLAFSILMQNYLSGPRDYRNVQDSIGVYLSTLRRSDLY